MHRIGLILLLVLGMVIAGCGDDSDSTTAPGSPEFVVPTTPDLAMQNLQLAWEEMNLTEYSKLLATEFTFVFEPAVKVGEIAGTTSWGVVDELSWAGALFSGESRMDPVTMEPIPPVVSIEFTDLTPVDEDWSYVPDDPEQGIHRNTYLRRYHTSMSVIRQGEALSTRVQGLEDFYASSIEIDGQTLWQIKIWEDLGTDGQLKADTPSISWSEFRAGI